VNDVAIGEGVPPAIEPLGPLRLREFLAYLGDHLRDNGADGLPYFQPMPKGGDLPSGWEAMFRESMARPVGEAGWRRVWLIRSDAGSIAAHVDLRAHAAPHAWHRCLLGMGVHRDFRRQGLGRQLLDYVESWVADEPLLEWIDLQVLGGNEPAVALYRAQGYRQTGAIDDMFRIDGLCMASLTMSKAICS
jgi:ribosomal protein S18 acetylase RimI-like enzyme